MRVEFRLGGYDVLDDDGRILGRAYQLTLLPRGRRGWRSVRPEGKRPRYHWTRLGAIVSIAWRSREREREREEGR